MSFLLGWQTDEYFSRRLKEEDAANERLHGVIRQEFHKAWKAHNFDNDINPKTVRRCRVAAIGFAVWAVFCFISHNSAYEIAAGTALVVLGIPFALSLPRRAAYIKFEREWKAEIANQTS